MLIKIDITDEKQFTNEEYDVLNNIFIRKAKELGILDKYTNEHQHWTVQCKIGED